MKTVEMAEATAPLSEYARRARKGTVVVTRRGKPLAAVVPLDSDDWEDFVVSQDPGFIEVIKRSEARYRAEGGISLDEMRRKYRVKPTRRPRRPR
jgi:prevent-host-death family protein